MSDRRERERHQASSSSAPQETPYLSRGRVCGLLWQLSQPAPFLVFLEVIERIYAWCLSSPAGGSFRRELFGVRPGAVYCDLEAQRAELLDDVNDFVERAKADAFRAEFEAESARIEVLMREHARLEAQIAEYQRRLTAQETRREETAETPVSAADLAAARSKLGAGFFHVALVGDAGCGKSALCNALRGVRNNAPDAAYVGACVGTTCAGVYPGPPHTQILFHDLPGAGTPEQSRTAYFRAHSLYAFDLLIVVWHGAVSDSTVRILRNAHPTQHVLLVRSKADLHLSNMLQDAEDALLDDDGTALATNPGAAAHTHTAPHETSSPHTAPHETASPHTAPQETSSPHTAPHETSSPHTAPQETSSPHTHEAQDAYSDESTSRPFFDEIAFLKVAKQEYCTATATTVAANCGDAAPPVFVVNQRSLRSVAERRFAAEDTTETAPRWRQRHHSQSADRFMMHEAALLDAITEIYENHRHQMERRTQLNNSAGASARAMGPSAEE